MTDPGRVAPSDDQGDEVVVTRSEEQLRGGTETVAVARVRVRKVIVTEERTVTVVLRHEELRLDIEPLSSDSPGGPSPDGADTVELVLHAEHPVVSTEVVAVERVHVSKHLVTGEESITGQVRREVVELDRPR